MNTINRDAQFDALFGNKEGEEMREAAIVIVPTCSFSHLKPKELGPALKRASTKRLEQACQAMGIVLNEDTKPEHHRQEMRLRLGVLLDPDNKAFWDTAPKNYSPWDIYARGNKTLAGQITADGSWDPTLVTQQQAYIDGKPLRTKKYSEAGKRGDVLKAERRAALGVAKRQPFADDEVRLIVKLFNEGVKPQALSDMVHGRVKKDMMWYIGTRRSYKKVDLNGPVAASLDRWMRIEDAADAAAEQMQAADVAVEVVVNDDLISNVLPFTD